MILRLKYFGMIAEAIGINDESVEISGDSITDLDTVLKNNYPKLNSLNYSFAVNQTMTNDDVIIKENDEVALLPPFAGG